MQQPSDDDLCPMCGKIVIDHTIRDLRACHPGSDHSLPFEEMTPANIELLASMTDQLAILAGTVDTAMGKMPLLCFKFSSSATGPLPDITLVGDHRVLRDASNLMLRATNSAIKAAR